MFMISATVLKKIKEAVGGVFDLSKKWYVKPQLTIDDKALLYKLRFAVTKETDEEFLLAVAKAISEIPINVNIYLHNHLRSVELLYFTYAQPYVKPQPRSKQAPRGSIIFG